MKQTRGRANLSNSLHQQLNAYALAASAAGVAMLALTQSAEAKVVYTPTHIRLQNNKPYPLDVDHNGKADFFLLQGGILTSVGRVQDLSVCHNPTTINKSYVCRYSTNVSNSMNQVVATKVLGPAAALRAGAKIQQSDKFAGTFKGHGVPVNMAAAFYHTTSTGSFWLGPWVNQGKGVKNRYLGLKFTKNSKFHFGWARMTVTTRKRAQFTTTLTGYAYETIPNKPIIAGQTTGPDVITVQPNSLGSLARGRKE